MLSIYLFSVQSFLLYGNQTTSPNITIIYPANHFKASVGVKVTRIICSDEGAGVDVSKIDDVDDAAGRESCRAFGKPLAAGGVVSRQWGVYWDLGIDIGTLNSELRTLNFQRIFFIPN